MKKLPRGIDNFYDVIQGDFYYVDKTKVIEDLFKEDYGVSLFLRPRRFGKSLFISMLEHFFDIDKKCENKDLFKGLYIEKSKYYEDRNTYPVINIDFKNLKQDTFLSVYNQFKLMIIALYVSKKYVYEVLDESEKEYFDRVKMGKGDEDDYKESLLKLSNFLYKYHHKKVIILIDEYDVPIQQGYIKYFYDEVVSFIRSVLSSCLKGNDSLYMGILTGVLKVSKESIFSDLNNLKVYSIMDDVYNEYFGFTDNETKELLRYYGLELTDEVKNMYDGYLFGDVSIYNPWSILNYAYDKKLNTYWVNTSGNDLIRKLLLETTNENLVSIEKLIEGRPLSFRYDDKITYKSFDDSSDLNNILNIMFVSGYLTVDSIIKESNIKMIYLKIPNMEVRELMTDIISCKSLDVNKNLEVMLRFKLAFINNDKSSIEEILNKMLVSVSFMDSQEYFYHSYVMGIFKAYLDDNEYIVKSNREAGSRRFDVGIERVDRSVGCIIEFKLSDSEEKMEEYAEVAKKQMIDKEYYKEFVLEGIENIYSYAIVFYDKKCIVR